MFPQPSSYTVPNSPSRSPLQGAEDLIECSICSETFSKVQRYPLGCSHEICCGCMFKVAKHQDPGFGEISDVIVVPCPFCRRDQQVNYAELKSLQLAKKAPGTTKNSGEPNPLLSSGIDHGLSGVSRLDSAQTKPFDDSTSRLTSEMNSQASLNQAQKAQISTRSRFNRATRKKKGESVRGSIDFNQVTQKISILSLNQNPYRSGVKDPRNDLIFHCRLSGKSCLTLFCETCMLLICEGCSQEAHIMHALRRLHSKAHYYFEPFEAEGVKSAEDHGKQIISLAYQNREALHYAIESLTIRIGKARQVGNEIQMAPLDTALEQPLEEAFLKSYQPYISCFQEQSNQVGCRVHYQQQQQLMNEAFRSMSDDPVAHLRKACFARQTSWPSPFLPPAHLLKDDRPVIALPTATKQSQLSMKVNFKVVTSKLGHFLLPRSVALRLHSFLVLVLPRLTYPVPVKQIKVRVEGWSELVAEMQEWKSIFMESVAIGDQLFVVDVFEADDDEATVSSTLSIISLQQERLTTLSSLDFLKKPEDFDDDDEIVLSLTQFGLCAWDSKLIFVGGLDLETKKASPKIWKMSRIGQATIVSSLEGRPMELKKARTEPAVAVSGNDFLVVFGGKYAQGQFVTLVEIFDLSINQRVHFVELGITREFMSLNLTASPCQVEALPHFEGASFMLVFPLERAHFGNFNGLKVMELRVEYEEGAQVKYSLSPGFTFPAGDLQLFLPQLLHSNLERNPKAATMPAEKFRELVRLGHLPEYIPTSTLLKIEQDVRVPSKDQTEFDAKCLIPVRGRILAGSDEAELEEPSKIMKSLGFMSTEPMVLFEE